LHLELDAKEGWRRRRNMKTKRSKILGMLALIAVLSLAVVACSPPIPQPPAANDPLNGTSWELVAYRKSRPIEGTTMTLEFEDGQLGGMGGCNHYFGSYELDGDKITVGPMGMTEMACMEPEGVMDQEMELTGYLSEAQSFRFDDDQLLIYVTDHEALTFKPLEIE
jgi:putative lipoprotein